MQSIRKKSFAAEQLARQKKTSPVVWVLVGVVVMVLAVGGFVIYQKMVVQKQVETEQIKSIAVLPFRGMSPKKDQEYLGDGIAETIINTLTQIGDINVPASTSSSAFKGKDLSIIEIGKQLNVETILEGTVQKEGNYLRITAQLINVADGFPLWSKRYEREFDSIFAIQDSISYAIVEELKGKLLGDEKAAIEKRYTYNDEAYNLYLQGRYYWNKRTVAGLKKGIELFQQAIEQDPTFALAYAGLADSHNLLPAYGTFPAHEYLPKAKAAALKALEIDNTLAEAYTSLALFRSFYERDWITAEKEFKRAIMLNPGYPTAHHWYAEYLEATGQLNESLAEIKLAQKLDPLSPVISRELGEKFYIMREYDKAIEQYQKILDMFPNYPSTYMFLGMAYYAKAMWEEAIEAYQMFVTLSGGSPLAVSCLGSAYAASGQKDEALEMLNQLDKLSKERYVSSFNRAYIYIALGDMDQAFEYLEKSYVEREILLTYIKVWPYYDPIRSDPRFKALLKKMGLPED